MFPGGCDLATAEAVCADETVASADIADHLGALVDKSLVVAVRVGDGVRFTQLQTLAEYGRERLAERGDAVRIRDAMAQHFAALCSHSAEAFTGDIQRAWLTAIDQEHDNLRAALDWAVATDDAETALMIAGGAAWPHWLTGQVVEGRRWLDDAFACGGEAQETHPGPGADRPRPPRLPRRRHRALRCRPGHRARDLRAPPRRRVGGVGPFLLRRAGRPSSVISTRPVAAGSSCSTSTASRPRIRSRSRPASTRRRRWRSWTAISTPRSATTGRRPKASGASTGRS